MQINKISSFQTNCQPFKKADVKKHTGIVSSNNSDLRTLPHYPLYFCGKKDDLKTLTTAIQTLKENSGQPLDEGMLSDLFEVLGTSASIDEIESSHTHPWSKHKFDHRESLLSTLEAISAATNYSPIKKSLGDYEASVNNSKVANALRETYTSETFSNLYNLCKDNGTFSMKFNEYGFPLTTDIGHNEELVMRSNVWVTDSARVSDFIKNEYPSKHLPLLEKLSKFYVNESREFKKICQDPSLFGTGRETENGYRHNGVGHSFNPETLGADRKFLAIRLDSQGLFLSKLSSSILKGDNEDVSQNMLEALAMIPLYMNAIGYPECTSCGSWENTRLHSITSDTEIVRAGLSGLQDMLESENPAVRKTAQKLEANYSKIKKEWGIEGSETLKDLTGKMIEAADKRLGENYLIEYEHEDPKEAKKVDAAMAFVPATAVLDKDNVLEDVRKNIEILESIKPLVSENGIVRYDRDAYENLNYELAIDSDENFSFDTINDRWTMVDTCPSALANKAEWFMVSDISKGYGVQLGKLLDYIDAEKRNPTSEEKELIEKCLKGETEYINRAYARITGENSVKANGAKCPEWAVPESYMAVSSLNDIKKSDKKTYLPGTNTPLSWAMASLYDASKTMAENLKKLERCS